MSFNEKCQQILFESGLELTLEIKSVDKVREFVSYICGIAKQRDGSRKLNLLTIIELILIFIEESVHVDSVYSDLIKLIPFSKPSQEGISKATSLLLSKSILNHQLHLEILKSLHVALEEDQPIFVKLPGDNVSFLSLSSPGLFPTQLHAVSPIISRSYTLGIWIRFEHLNHDKSVSIFHYRSPTLELECVLSKKPSGTSPNISIRIAFSSSPLISGFDASFHMSGPIEIPLGSWHFLVFKHTSLTPKPRGTLLIDGIIHLEQDLPYPNSTSSVQWIFGAGLNGSISNITLYSEELDQSLIQLLTDVGPNTTSLHNILSGPQSSYETGHSKLSIRLCKGRSVHTRYTPLFSLTALHFHPDANLPIFTSGESTSDQVKLTSHAFATNTRTPEAKGSCNFNIQPNWVSQWIRTGGVALPLYLLWQLCTDSVGVESREQIQEDVSSVDASAALGSLQRKFLSLVQNSTSTITPAATSSSTSSGNKETEVNMILIQKIRQIIQILSVMLRKSAELRDMFIQQHGFHILSYCLRQLPNKSIFFDIQTLQICFELVHSLGEDLIEGDGIASALQGLLFDFSLWSESSLETKEFLLTKTSELVTDHPMNLYQSIGVQRILDVMRLHVMHLNDSQPNSTSTTTITSIRKPSADTGLPSYLNLLSKPDSKENSNSNPNNSASIPLNEILLKCADSGHNLLCIAMHAALDVYQATKGSAFIEGEMIITCLEETGSVLLAERLLRSLLNLQYVAPATLKKVLLSTRFVETTALQLLTKRGYSTEVRRSALILLLWLVSLDIEKLPLKLYRIRDNLVALPTPFHPKISKLGMKLVSSSVPVMNSSQYFMDPDRALEVTNQLETLIKPLRKIWALLTMHADAVEKAFEDGSWSEPDSELVEQQVSNVDDLLDVFTKDGPLGRVQLWMILPLASVCLSVCNTELKLEALSALSILVKTDEMQAEVLGRMPDKGVIMSLLRLLHVNESPSTKSDKIKNNNTLSTVKSMLSPLNPDDPFSILSDVSTPGGGGGGGTVSSSNSHDDSWATVNTFGDTVIISENREKKLTCDELTIDILSSILMDKMRFHGASAWKMWKELQYTLIEMFGHGSTSLTVLKRIVALVLHKITRASGSWNLEGLYCITQLLLMMESRHLCGDLPDVMDETNQITSSNLLHDISGQIRTEQTDIEKSVLSFLLDLLVSLRKAATNGSLGGTEVNCVQAGLRILLGCLRRVDTTTGERLASEISAIVTYMCEPWGFAEDSKAFQEVMLKIFLKLKSAIKDKSLPIGLRYRYEATVFGVVSGFLRQRTESLRKTDPRPIAIHTTQVVDSMVAAEGIIDIDGVFNVLEFSLRPSDSISFADDDVDTLISTGATRTSRNSSITASQMTIKSSSSTLQVTVPILDFITSNSDPTTSILLADNMGVSGVIGSTSSSQSRVDDPNNNLHNWLSLSTSMSDKENLKAKDILTGSIEALDLLDFTDTDAEPVTGAASANMTVTPIPGNQMTQSASQTLLTDMAFVVPTPAVSTLSQPMEPLSLVPSHPPLPPPPSSVTSSADHLDVLAPFQSSTDSPVMNTASRDAQKELFQKWLQVRIGILQDRIDTERGRLSKCMESLDFTLEATIRYWNRYKRKIESEILQYEHHCEWKLAVAHEGPFPARKRIVLRPKFEGEGSERLNIIRIDKEKQLNIDSESLKQALARACVGYIKDVRRADNLAPDDVVLGDTVVVDGGKGASTGTPGTGWGMVDADGSEEGYGVVGLAQDVNEDTLKPSSSDKVGDVSGDIRLLEEGFRQGRSVETGPCHQGTQHMNGGPVIQCHTVYLVTPSGNYKGLLSFNSREIYFSSDKENQNEALDTAAVTLIPRHRMRRRRWILASIGAIYLRRYRLRDSALEVFFRRGKHRNFFVDFGHSKEDAKHRNAFAYALMKMTPKSAIKQWPGVPSHRILAQLNVQEQWQNGEISNFEYLMSLNTLAGRSYSDLTQYPVMPWVIAQYTKDTIDLSDPTTFRDLSKPIGALNPNRLNDFMERYQSLGETSDIPAFMYGSHYSTMVGVVLHYLVRLQPFAALHQDIQNGHFDVPDRLFNSIPRTWEHNTTMLSEVKELTPEWFTLPEFLKNVNSFDLGIMQDGSPVNDVILPPWSSTAEEFIRINREALESEYVSAHLHEWIDLIFGYKQKGPAAVEACNVFYYLTYYGSVDREMIKDDALRRATELQIAHFGQCPIQLFANAHPPRKSSTVPRPLRLCFDEISQTLVDPTTDEESLAFHSLFSLLPRIDTTHTVLDTVILTGRLICILDNGVIEVYRYGASDAAKATTTGNRIPMRAKQIQAARRLGARVVTTLKRVNMSTTTRGFPPSNLSTSSSGIPPPIGTVLSVEDSSVSSTTGLPKTWDGQGIISFDDDEHTEKMAAMGSRNGSISSAGDGSATTAATSTRGGAVSAPGIAELSDNNDIDRIRPVSPPSPEALVVVEKDTTHFEVVPRVPLAKQHHNSLSSNQAIDMAHLIHFTSSGSLILSAGKSHGLIFAREIDTLSGLVRTAGDFTCHHNTVTCMASDFIPGGGSVDVIASCDADGIILVWTITLDKSTNIRCLSKRPQRLFRCIPGPCSACDLSWNMGILVCASSSGISVFSVERNERIRLLDIKQELCMTITDTESYVESAVEGDLMRPDNNSKTKTSKGNDKLYKCDTIHLCLNNNGMILVHAVVYPIATVATAATTKLSTTPSSEGGLMRTGSPVKSDTQQQQRQPLAGSQDIPPSTTDDDSGRLKSVRHFLLAITVAGVRTGLVQVPSPVTCLSCPGRGDVVISGHFDGSIRLFDTNNLELLIECKPHLSYVRCFNNNSSLESFGRLNLVSSNTSSTDPTVAPIVNVRVGPELNRPVVLCVTAANGAMYIRALPDFVRWERNRNLSAFSQIVNVPLQVVRGSIQQAQAWTSDAAGALAVNAKSLSDEAFKKINSSKLFKGVGQLFGMAMSKDS